MYNIMSPKAEEFINNEEILSSIAYGLENKSNRPLIESILKKARNFKGISHREAIVLLECDLEDLNKSIASLAREIKDKFYGNRIVMFAPLYLSNYCVNNCTYCPFHYKNKSIPRKKLTQEEIKKEVIALQDMGHKRLALELGEDPINNPIEYVLESINTIYNIKHKNGAIRRVNVNIAATTTENYRKLKEAEIGTYILFQETYNKVAYKALHPSGPKANYAYHTEAMDRAIDGGIDDVGIGVLFGLELYRYDFIGLLMHTEHLEAYKGIGPHTISVPRIRPADDINIDDFTNAISDEIFEKIISILRIAVPYTGIIVSTREDQKVREKVLCLGVSQLSGGSKTDVGGYSINVNTDNHSNNFNTSQCVLSKPDTDHTNLKHSDANQFNSATTDTAQTSLEQSDVAQFDIEDTRTLDEIVNWLVSLGYIPSFCTACYREGRTGDRFMSLVKSGQIANCCQPNALITLKEYLCDYASDDTKQKGLALINSELSKIPNAKVKQTASNLIKKISQGERDFRF